MVRSEVRGLVCLFLISCGAVAQNVTLRGQVSDESGAVIPGAAVTLSGTAARKASADVAGIYVFEGLLPGGYTVQASSPGMVQAQPAKVQLKAGVQTLNLVLNVASRVDQITVK